MVGGKGALKENVDVDGTTTVGLAGNAAGPDPTSGLLSMIVVMEMVSTQSYRSIVAVVERRRKVDGFMKRVVFNLQPLHWYSSNTLSACAGLHNFSFKSPALISSLILKGGVVASER